MPVALLIEDDPQIGQLLIQELAREDWQINWCRDGDAGLRVLRSHSAAMVLLDLMLPDIDGLALCWMMRRQSDVPILILSARDELTDRVLGLDAGADDYLVKPFSITEVLARMRALIRRSRRMSSSSGDWLFAGKIQYFGVWDLFEFVINSYRVRMRKPDPRIFQHLLHKIAIEPENILFVDDKAANVTVAENLGMHGHVFSNTVDFTRHLAMEGIWF